MGLVTLPGAFVGMLLGGASPIEAARVQLTVLFALLGAEALAAAVATLLIARVVTQPGPARVAGGLVAVALELSVDRWGRGGVQSRS